MASLTSGQTTALMRTGLHHSMNAGHPGTLHITRQAQINHVLKTAYTTILSTWGDRFAHMWKKWNICTGQSTEMVPSIQNEALQIHEAWEFSLII